MKPLVSICCLAYNHEKYIEQALDGFLNQKTDFPFEILIHDDASCDRTARIIREYAEKYPDIIKPLLQTENQYSKGIRNISGVYNFPRVQGTYVAMCEGDDYWCDDRKLQKQVDYMRGHPECALCIHSARIVTENGAMTGGLMRPYRENKVIQPEEIVDKTQGYPTAGMLFVAEAVRSIPDYYTNCPIGDIPLQLMLAEKGNAYYMDEPMSVYRFGIAGSWSQDMLDGDYIRKQETYAEAMQKMYEEFDRHSGGRFHQQAERAWRRIRFLTRVNIKDWERVYAPENHGFLKELSLRERFFFQLESKMPGLYRSLRTLWLKKRKI